MLKIMTYQSDGGYWVAMPIDLTKFTMDVIALKGTGETTAEAIDDLLDQMEEAGLYMRPLALARWTFARVFEARAAEVFDAFRGEPYNDETLERIQNRLAIATADLLIPPCPKPEIKVVFWREDRSVKIDITWPEPLPESGDLCEDCPPKGYPTDETRCAPCPRR